MFPNTHDVVPLPPRANLEQYKKLAKELVKAAPDPEKVLAWAAARSREYADPIAQFALSREKLRLADAQYVIARIHGFTSWPKFVKHIEAPRNDFDRAVDAIVEGDAATLRKLLRKNPDLVRERSTREHRSTLLHYVAANGVENFRQKTPKNAVEIARILLDAGADVNAEADLYGGGARTLGLTATSVHPEVAGVQNALMQLLLDRGAAMDDGIVASCLANGRGNAAQFLAERGAQLDIEGAAGVGRLDIVREKISSATEKQKGNGLAWACQFGHTAVVDFLLQHGVTAPNALHWAAWGAHRDIIELLLKRGAPGDVKDDTHHGTPLAWALYAWSNRTDGVDRTRYYDIVRLLRDAGATPDRESIDNARVRSDPRMREALRL